MKELYDPLTNSIITESSPYYTLFAEDRAIEVLNVDVDTPEQLTTINRIEQILLFPTIYGGVVGLTRLPYKGDAPIIQLASEEKISADGVKSLHVTITNKIDKLVSYADEPEPSIIRADLGEVCPATMIRLEHSLETLIDGSIATLNNRSVNGICALRYTHEYLFEYERNLLTGDDIC